MPSNGDLQALAGLKVVDMATVFAGPGTAKYLADFGADVIKVESPAGDGTRAMGWLDPRDGASFIWKVIGRGKRTVVLDLKTAEGLDAMRRLIDGADVLIENLRPGTLERLGLAARRSVPSQRRSRDLARQRIRPDRSVRVASRGSPRSRKRWAALPRSMASPTARRCCRRSRSPTSSPPSSVRSR